MSEAARQESVRAGASSYRWLVIPLWMVGHVWGYTVLDSLGFLLPSIREDLGLTPIQEGLLGSVPRIANILLAIPMGLYLSGFRPKLLTSISLFGMAGLALFQGWAPLFVLLLLGRFLYGVVSVAREPARALLLRQWVPAKEIVIVNSLGNAVWGLGAIGFILTPLILNLLDDSWRQTFFVFAGISVVVAFMWQILGKERITPEYVADVASQSANPIGVLSRYREVWLAAVAFVGIGINFSAFSTFWPSYMLDERDFSLVSSATLMAIGGGLMAVAGIVIGLLARRTGKKRRIIWVAGIFIALSNTGMLWTGSYPLLVLLALVNGISFSLMPIVLTIPYELPDIKPREVAVAATFLTAMIWLGSFIGPLAAGAIHEVSGDLRMALMVTSLAALTATVGGLLLPRSWDRPPVLPEPVV